MLLKMDDDTWNRLNIAGSEEKRKATLDLLAGLLRTVPDSFLRNNISVRLPSARMPGLKEPELARFARTPSLFFGKVFQLDVGHITLVEEIPLNQEEREKYGFHQIFRCRFEIDDQNRVDVLSAFVPGDWQRSDRAHTVSIRERASATGICLPFHEQGAAAPVPLIVTPRIVWFPDNFLGRAGFDYGSLEAIPPLAMADLKQAELDLPPSLKHLSRQEIIRRAFKFTEADVAPFYGLLQVAHQTGSRSFEREALAEWGNEGKKPRVTDLFQKPRETRGKPILLHGTAKRVVATPVDDAEVQKLYGIDHYYQIFLYTAESQGNPIVVCTPALPTGMPEGTDSDYAEPISVVAVPYKLWVYETGAKIEDGGSDADRRASFAPLLVGGCPTWHPEKRQAGATGSFEMHVTFGLCALLIFAWVMARRFKSRRKIEFKFEE